MDLENFKKQLDGIIQENIKTPEVLYHEDITKLNSGFIEVYPSEWRDENVKGKFYAYAKLNDSSGNYWTTDDCDSIEEAIKEVKSYMKEDWFTIVYKNIDDIIKEAE